MCSATSIYTGPISSAIHGIDLSLPAGLILPAAVYLTLIGRRRPASSATPYPAPAQAAAAGPMEGIR